MSEERDAIPWWKSLRDGEARLQRCQSCETWRWPPRAMCNRCGSFETEWVKISMQASVASWIVNHHAFSPDFDVPYTVAMCRLAEQSDVLLPGLFRGERPQIRVGLPVRAEISIPTEARSGSDPTPILTWVPTTHSPNE